MLLISGARAMMMAAWMTALTGCEGGLVARSTPSGEATESDTPEANWEHLAPLPAECQLEIARDAKVVRPTSTFRWEPDCGQGCLRWAGAGNIRQVGRLGERTVVSMIQEDGTGKRRARYTVFADLHTGEPLLVLRDRLGVARATSDPLCVVSATGIGEHGLSFSVQFADFDDEGHTLERSWLSVLRTDALGRRESLRALVHEENVPLPIDELAVGRTHVAVRLAQTVFLADDQRSYQLQSGTAVAARLGMVGENPFWEQQGDSSALVLASGSQRIRYGAAGADVRHPTADGDELAWLEARDYDPASRTYAKVELWASQHDGNGLSPRRVQEVRGHAAGRLGDGLYVHPEPHPDDAGRWGFGLYSLADGQRTWFDPSPHPASRALWVSSALAVVEEYGNIYQIDLGSML